MIRLPKYRVATNRIEYTTANVVSDVEDISGRELGSGIGGANLAIQGPGLSSYAADNPARFHRDVTQWGSKNPGAQQPFLLANFSVERLPKSHCKTLHSISPAKKKPMPLMMRKE
jgi:hypothetical protein